MMNTTRDAKRLIEIGKLRGWIKEQTTKPMSESEIDTAIVRKSVQARKKKPC